MYSCLVSDWWVPIQPHTQTGTCQRAQERSTVTLRSAEPSGKCVRPQLISDTRVMIFTCEKRCVSHLRLLWFVAMKSVLGV